MTIEAPVVKPTYYVVSVLLFVQYVSRSLCISLALLPRSDEAKFGDLPRDHSLLSCGTLLLFAKIRALAPAHSVPVQYMSP